MISQKKSTILIWAAAIFALLIVCLITDRNNLAERTLYSSQKEMQSALQGTYAYYTSRGERKTWRIHDDTAVQTYENGTVFSYTITKWHPHRGALTLTLDTTTQKESLFVSSNGSLFDQHNLVFQREEQSDNTDKSVNRKPVSEQNQPAAQNKPSEQSKSSEQSKPAETTPTPVYTSPKSQKKPELPDCGDYESYEDFMDDWDGYMPDGSDAEDYWEDW